MDVKVSDHFWMSELECRCDCESYIGNDELLRLLEEVRAHFGKPVKVTSSTRCESHNAAVGGRVGSRHTKGEAADIQIAGVAPSDIYRYFDREYPNALGLGLYNTFVHVDVRLDKGRWNG